jgi:hypothetical protein
MSVRRATPVPVCPALCRLALAAVALATPMSPARSAAQTAPSAPCEAGGPHADFDFWVGEWDVFTPDGRQAGTNRIEKSERGCLLVEHWTSAEGDTGTSINFYDPARARWRQVWVSFNGGVIEIQGGLREGSMVLGGVLANPDGRTQPFRGSWTPNEDGSVRQHFEISENGGRTWTTWFDGRYVPRS